MSRHPLFLASVSNGLEATTALMGGAEIIDCKNPQDGPLGALSLDAVREIVQIVNKRVPVSATIGNQIDDPEMMYKAAFEMSQTGVDFIKIGFFFTEDYHQSIQRLEALTQTKTKIIGLFFAELGLKLHLLERLSCSGFSGVMVDTLNKNGAPLPEVMPLNLLRKFIKLAHGAKLFVGLAGSLRIEHLEKIIPLKPDVIGFRGALCHNQQREDQLDGKSVQEVAGKLKALRSHAFSSNANAVFSTNAKTVELYHD